MEMEEEGDNVAGPSREISGQEAGMSAGRAQGAPALPSGWSTPNSEVLWVELEVMAAKPQRTKAVLPVHGSQECGPITTPAPVFDSIVFWEMKLLREA